MTGALARLVRTTRRPDPAARCELCAAALAERHRHLFDVRQAELRCACEPCSLLFADTSQGRYRLVPRRRVRLPPVDTSPLGVPVGLAFFVVGDGEVHAHYPSPAGATRWEVDAAGWRELTDRRPELRTMARDVEALLVNTAHDRQEHWIVPLDDCYRLVAVVRREWRGLSGGGTVQPAINAFFAALEPHDDRGGDRR
ncbi:DUF5947 family protein [Saccharopolyspora rosea]|uniref:DUF5947 family protein n=1 Tax=Saccharopolyspora rosea TaxID=524884 RepID=A0ABW3FYS7_9PSEU|nr:DUF5947 family protein [Saccharopolyspora rosea]